MNEYEFEQEPPLFFDHTYQKLEEMANEAIREGNEALATDILVQAYEAANEELDITNKMNDREKLGKAMDQLELRINRLTPKPNQTAVDHSINRAARDVKNLMQTKKMEGELVKPIDPEYDFSKVAGMDYIKNLMNEKIISPLKHPMEFDAVVETDFSGVLLYGAPGCGKTYISKALAGEVKKQTHGKVNFYKVNGADFRKYGPNKVDMVIRSIFETVANNEPAVLFIDEVEAVVPRRTGYGAESRITSTALDAFEEFKGKNVLIVAATNLPYKVDFALMGHHRLGDPVFVGAPEYKAREDIFKVHLEGKNKEENLDLNYLAALTEGYSASDIWAIVDKAGRKAAMNSIEDENLNTPQITLQDLEYAIEETESTLWEWCTQMKDDILDGRFPMQERIYRKGISSKYGFIIDEIEKLETTLTARSEALNEDDDE